MRLTGVGLYNRCHVKSLSLRDDLCEIVHFLERPVRDYLRERITHPVGSLFNTTVTFGWNGSGLPCESFPVTDCTHRTVALSPLVLGSPWRVSVYALTLAPLK